MIPLLFNLYCHVFVLDFVCLSVYFHLYHRSVLLSRSQIYWLSQWCWASRLRLKKLALRGIKERRRVSAVLLQRLVVISNFYWALVLVSDLEVLRSFQNQIAAIQRDAVWWLHSVVPTISKLGAKDYVHWSVHWMDVIISQGNPVFI